MKLLTTAIFLTLHTLYKNLISEQSGLSDHNRYTISYHIMQLSLDTESLVNTCLTIGITAVIVSPIIVPYVRKLFKRLDPSYKYEVYFNYDDTSVSHAITVKSVTQHLLKTYPDRVYNIVTMGDANFLECDIAGQYNTINIRIIVTHRSMLIRCSSTKHDSRQLMDLYKQWIYNIIKSYETMDNDYLVIDSTFVNVNTFMEKYVHCVTPHFKGVNFLVDVSRVDNSNLIMYKSDTYEYGVFEDKPSSEDAVIRYGNIRFIETFNNIDIYMEIINKSIWLHYVDHNGNNINTQKLVVDRITKFMSEKSSVCIFNTSDLDNNGDYKRIAKLNKIPLFLQTDALNLHQSVLLRADTGSGFGVLLHGQAGNGKTTYVKYLALTLKRDIYLISLSRIDSAKDLFDISHKLPKNSIILIEDIDRAWNTKIINTDDKFGSDIIDKKIVMDDAFVRDGRFDFKIQMNNCDHKQLTDISQHFFGNLVTDELNNYNDTFTETRSVATVYADIQNSYLRSKI